MHTGIWWENLKERDRLENLDTGGTIILKRILIGWDGMYWIHLAHDRGMRRNLGKTRIDLRFP
jgi:hypothetical protein